MKNPKAEDSSIGPARWQKDTSLGTAKTIEVFGAHEGETAINTFRRALKVTYGYDSYVFTREVSAAGLTLKVNVVVGFEPEKER